MSRDSFYWKDYEELQTEYDLKRLKEKVEVCNDRIQNAREFKLAVEERIDYVGSVKFKPYVYLNKGREYRPRSPDAVLYSTSVFLVPIDPFDEELKIEGRIFPHEVPGKPDLKPNMKAHHTERAQVVQHAVELAKAFSVNGKPATVITNMEFYKKELSVVEGFELIELPQGWYRHV